MGDMMPPQMPMPEPMMGQDPMMCGDEQMSPEGEPYEIGGDDKEGGVGSDVKKYSGELSQALNTYNEENPSDDEKLNKYAINMIAAQVANSLSDKDKRSVIKKLNGDEDDMSSDEQPEMDGQMMEQAMNDVVNEITNELMDDERRTKRGEKYITNDKVSDRDPFVSNRH